MKKILISNSVFGVGQAAINLVLIFFTVPLFIKMLGSESYGVFALIMVIGSLNTLTNLGLNNALLKFIAEQGRSEESNTDILVALAIIMALIVPVTAFAIYFNKFILSVVLKVPNNLLYLSKPFFNWVVLANALLLFGQVFKSVLDGLQKIYITSLQQIIYNIFYWGLILTVLIWGYDLPEVGLAIFIAALIWTVLTINSMINEWGKISFAGFNASFKSSAKKQLNYGLKIYSGGLISFFYEPLSKILISNFIGVSAVGFYDIALRIKGQLWGFISKIFFPLLPFISEQKDIKVIRKYVHDLEQKTFLIIIPVIVMLILLMHSFINTWIGHNVDIISITSVYIVSFHLIGSTVIPNYQFLMAKNLAQKTIILQLSNVIFNAAAFLLTVHFTGYYALVIGNIAGILSSFLISIYYQKRYLNSLIFDSPSQLLRLVCTFLILLSIGYLFKIVLPKDDILILAVIPIIIAITTVLCFRVFRLVKRADIYRYFGKSNKTSFILANIFKY